MLKSWPLGKKIGIGTQVHISLSKKSSNDSIFLTSLPKLDETSQGLSLGEHLPKKLRCVCLAE